ncbi:MAG TPA: hypothetical protein PKK23_20000 [Nitrospirales bacterium]|nr:hypothetical protein [Nitrospiraceae bacterium]HNP31340.1 hypothetical protein [Nitrospirales bacterium]
MLRFIIFLLLALGVGILIPVVEARDNGTDAYSQLFLFRIQPGATWELDENSLTKGKSMASLCVPVTIFEQPPELPVGSGKVCLSGQDKQKEALSLWDLTIYMNFSSKTHDTAVLHIPETTVVTLTKAMTNASRANPLIIVGASREGTNAVLSGTGKFQGAHGTVEAFGVVDTVDVKPKETVSKYPFLGDIPLLGALFQRTTIKQ